MNQLVQRFVWGGVFEGETFVDYFLNVGFFRESNCTWRKNPRFWNYSVCCSDYFDFQCDSIGSDCTVPDRRPFRGYGVTPCVIHRAAANMSIKLISTYAMLEVSREVIFCCVYIATHLNHICAVYSSDSAIVSTKGVVLQGIATRRVKQMKRVR